ncbi:MAG: DUF4145 domain-containing protein [Phycisphaeraceae bacterium]|nr:DUF4145 domain-containing protein [Phycisphaeraceae bacterium]
MTHDSEGQSIADFVATLPLNTQAEFLEVHAWSESMRCESDRGAALVSAAYLEECLERLIRCSLVESGKHADCLFESGAPFASFSAKIRFAFAIGLINSGLRHTLDMIRLIRNEFAHSFDSLSFDTPLIASRCRELKLAVPGYSFGSLSMRERFELASGLAFGWFQGSTRRVRPLERVWYSGQEISELSETERTAFIDRVKRVQSGAEPPLRSWFV